jgi:hypothetical protein
MAATSDCDVMAQLTLTNKQLVQTNHHLTKQLGKALAELAQHKNQQTTKPKPNAPTKPTASNTSTRPQFDHTAWLLSLDPTGYCWSHGYCGVCGHNSRECKGKLLGHQDDATRTNTMGGSEKGKAWPIGEAPNSDYSKIISRSYTLCHTPSQHTNRTPTAIADTGASVVTISDHNIRIIPMATHKPPSPLVYPTATPCNPAPPIAHETSRNSQPKHNRPISYQA